jgi:hypothetical protein
MDTPANGYPCNHLLRQTIQSKNLKIKKKKKKTGKVELLQAPPFILN